MIKSNENRISKTDGVNDHMRSRQLLKRRFSNSCEPWPEPEGRRHNPLLAWRRYLGSRSQHHHHRPSFKLGILFHDGNLFKFSGDSLQQCSTTV
jgi:hypothetical protein